MPYWLRFTFWRTLGELADVAGFPGFVRETEYASEATATTVTVQRRSLYTVVTVNGVAVYFNRLSGLIDGVSRPSDCRTDEAPASFHSAN